MPCRPLQVKVYSGLLQKTPLTRVMTHLSVIGSLCFCQFGNVTCNLFFRIVLGLLKNVKTQTLMNISIVDFFLFLRQVIHYFLIK